MVFKEKEYFGQSFDQFVVEIFFIFEREEAPSTKYLWQIMQEIWFKKFDYFLQSLSQNSSISILPLAY